VAVPFGGYKESGIGRVGGPEGLEACQEIKSVYMPALPMLYWRLIEG
jgi:aldehyde dehydrogenase (NAD+)